MKKLVAILLLSIHLFNIAGYSIFFQYHISKSESTITRKIDAGRYDRSALIMLKVPMNLPYFTDWQDFERVEGEIEIDGIHYTYVEKKLSQDTMYLACLPNLTKTELTKAKVSYGNAVNTDAANEKQGGNSVIKKAIFGAEYYDPAAVTVFSNFSATTVERIPHFASSLAISFLPAPYSPPDMA